MRNLFVILFLTMVLIGCKTTPINQKENNKKVGLWIEKYEIDTIQCKSVGKYKNGEPVKKWLNYTGNAISKKEVYRKNKCIITNYNPNGTIQSKGKTKLVVTGPEIHWFYYGDWKYFDENGIQVSTRKYENGELISDIKTPIVTKSK
ncbi:hypothetical protein [Flavobacterium sp.]|uniref:hypothetical protein n=1 Tax=Flavobacterium sp. TaxID=239 RepID=UPI002C5C5BF6|nr:hypothetical protein [Flavobacterium sp.]HSD09043.1 hypothetical protein [Flavobacterium sp.]